VCVYVCGQIGLASVFSLFIYFLFGFMVGCVQTKAQLPFGNFYHIDGTETGFEFMYFISFPIRYD
jgi:hypothetical protein